MNVLVKQSVSIGPLSDSVSDAADWPAPALSRNIIQMDRYYGQLNRVIESNKFWYGWWIAPVMINNTKKMSVPANFAYIFEFKSLEKILLTAPVGIWIAEKFIRWRMEVLFKYFIKSLQFTILKRYMCWDLWIHLIRISKMLNILKMGIYYSFYNIKLTWFLNRYRIRINVFQFLPGGYKWELSREDLA